MCLVQNKKLLLASILDANFAVSFCSFLLQGHDLLKINVVEEMQIGYIVDLGLALYILVHVEKYILCSAYNMKICLKVRCAV